MIKGDDGKSVQIHNRPVYWARHEDLQGNSIDLLLFTGRRWALIDRSVIGLQLPENATDASALANALELERLNGARLPEDAIKFITETADFSSEACSPVGLSWFHAIYPFLTVADSESDTFPRPDMANPLEVSFGCSICNNATNPCLFDGVCQPDGCVCKYGTAGSLCEVLPVGDGVCNEHFNTEEFEYDGGDCCGATCNSPSCGLETMDFAFGSVLATDPGNGFPHCKDPTMTSLNIVAEPFERIGAKGDGTWSARIQLDCDGKNHLFLPLGNEFDQGENETVMVREAADCVFHVTSQDLRGDTILRVIDSNGVVLAEVVPDVAERKSVAFSALSPCIRDSLTNSKLPDRGTVDYNSLKWTNNNMIEGFQCGDPFLYQRFALASLNYATGNSLQRNHGWLASGPHCNEWPGVACNRDRSVVRLDIGKRTSYPILLILPNIVH